MKFLYKTLKPKLLHIRRRKRHSQSHCVVSIQASHSNKRAVMHSISDKSEKTFNFSGLFGLVFNDARKVFKNALVFVGINIQRL